ncbi:MAG: inorganic diphosphatase [Patescibacteria group bacterium]|nr:inorganic diphosphatase [Patescibacteria group bacterium]
MSKNLETFEVIIECVEGSNLKYEFNEQTEQFDLDFTFGEGVVFPYNYGFIPGTLGGDGDTLDVMVLSAKPLKTGDRVECVAIGMLEMLDRGEVDNKIVAVPVDDGYHQKFSNVFQVPKEWVKEWQDFFAEIARQKKKVLEIKGIAGKDLAEKEIEKSKIA